ncbi:MAG: hypothetical protein JRS35_21305 [Deltaproteobacteria bacterium]|nr:hypothetical protein [Deltaproteobacteria bacterium]
MPRFASTGSNPSRGPTRSRGVLELVTWSPPRKGVPENRCCSTASTSQTESGSTGGRRWSTSVSSPSTLADREGLARLRVPYATVTTAPTRPAGPYTLRSGGRSQRIRVSDAQVRQGAVIAIGGYETE